MLSDHTSTTEQHMNTSTPIPSSFINGGDEDGMPVFGILHGQDFIHEPYRSRDGRHLVDPSAYGLSRDQADQIVKLNGLIAQATDALISTTCLEVQSALGLDKTDASFFNNSGHRIALAGTVRAFIRNQLSEESESMPEHSAERPRG